MRHDSGGARIVVLHRLVRTPWSLEKLPWVLCRMKNVGDENVRVIMVKVDGIRKTTHQNSPHVVKSNREMFRVIGNSGKRFLQATKKLISKTQILLLIPPVGLTNIGFNLRKKDHGSSHDRTEFFSSTGPTKARRMAFPQNEPAAVALLQQLVDDPARPSDPRQSSPINPQPTGAFQEQRGPLNR